MHTKPSRLLTAAGITAAAALVLSGCAGSNESKSEQSGTDTVHVAVNQLLQHPALDATYEGFKEAFADAGYKEGENITFDHQNANGEQSTALTIAQKFATSDADLVFAIATPAAQATAQAVTDKPVLFSAVTDPVAAGLVDSNENPGGNVTGTSDMAQVGKQLELLQEIVPDAKTVGIVYSSGEVNSEVQVEAAQAAGADLGLQIKTQTVSNANEIQQATEALGDVDAIYVPTDNTVVAGISALVGVAEAKQIPVIGAEAGTVEGGAVATLGIDYKKLGYQTGKMALAILEGKKPADTPVEFSESFNYLVNPKAAERQGVKLPESLLQKAETVE